MRVHVFVSSSGEVLGATPPPGTVGQQGTTLIGSIPKSEDEGVRVVEIDLPEERAAALTESSAAEPVGPQASSEAPFYRLQEIIQSEANLRDVTGQLEGLRRQLTQ